MAGRRRGRTTMGDVAEAAGVSQMTVSRVMRNADYISDEVRTRVLRAAKDTGYVHNRLATGLRTKTTPLVAVVLPTLGNRVFSEVLTGVNDALADRGMQPVFGVTEYSEEREEALVRDLLSWSPSGILLPGLEHSVGTRELVRASGLKVVEVMDLDGDPLSVAVGISQRAAGADMARHLLGKGHRNFALIGAGGGRDSRAGKRLAAFTETVRQAGGRICAERIDAAPSSMPLGRKMTAELLASEQPDAIYFSNDDLAAGGLMHCLANGIAVPRKVALAGFNGLSFLDALPLRLTTTQTPRHEIGLRAGQILSGDTTTGREDLGTTLIPGETS